MENQRFKRIARTGFGVFMFTLLALAARNAGAFEVPTGNDDLQVRWDNTFRYNYAQRLEKQDPHLIANPSIDDGNRNFDKGPVSNRLDLLSEFDVVYKGSVGLRASGAGWYDYQYSRPFDNTSPNTSNHLEDGKPAVGLSDYARKYFRGPSGELLDAFGFAKFDIANMPIAIKAGRHTLFWGEGVLLGGAVHGVSYAQMPIDLAKGLAVPGSEAKELFRPLNQVSLQAQPLASLSIAAQYFLDWEPYRAPEDGTYLDFNDALLWGGESVILTNGVRVVRGHDVNPAKRGNWGASARWTPEWLDGTLGFYYRDFADMLPQVYVTPDLNKLAANNCGTLPQAQPCAIIGRYNFDYPGDIKLYGISLSKNIGGISIGAELSYRENMPLVSEPAVLVPLQLPPALQPVAQQLIDTLRQAQLPAGAPAIPQVVFGDEPGSGDAIGARGNTMHGVVNAIGFLPKQEIFGFRIFDAATYIGELGWSRWDRVTENENLFKGRSDYAALDRVSRQNFTGAVVFNPTWFQVFPAVDLSLPLSYSRGLKGNSAVQLGGNEDAGLYSFGIAADLYQRYRIDLRYTDFYGDYTVGSNGAATVLNGATSALSDRGFVSLTLKTTF